MKKLILIFTLFFTFLGFAQDIYTKDGVSLGSRDSFIKLCTASADESMELNGIKIKTKKYCSCVSDNVIPQIMSKDLMEAAENDEMVKLFLRDDNLKLIMACVEGNVKIKDDFDYKTLENQEGAKEFAVKTCTDELLKEAGSDGTWNKKNANKFCSCAMNKLIDNGYSFGDIKKIEDENSDIYLNLLEPCLEWALDK